jgi:6-phosphogluconolactonase
MELIEYADGEMMMMDLANRMAGELENALFRGDLVSMAVPGGTTPGPIFDTLSAIDLDWSRVRVMLTDERWVPESSERSNTTLLRQRLLTGRAAAATLVPLYADADLPEAAISDLETGVSECLPLDICLLGMGTDMHTASIFPGADQLQAALHGDGLIVPMRAPGAPEPRVTLSAKALNTAQNRHVVITGIEKREALERAKSLPVEEAPIAAFLKGTTFHWAES